MKPEIEFELTNMMRKAIIKQEPSKLKRFGLLVWHLVSFPFVWLFYNIRDWRTFLIFGIVCAVVSCEVWIPYLMAVITWGTTFSKIMLGVGSSIWGWWLLPGTPFLPLCIGITIGVKAFFNKCVVKIKKKK